jgi:glyoxylase-like metal-dependent hydrolase (beta-lactamase superfamily II)
MTEPKTRAKQAVRLTSDIAHWTITDDRIQYRSDAYAILDPKGTVLIDPLPLDKDAFDTLGKVTAICITRACHQRSAWRYRRELGARIYAPQGAKDLEERPDVSFGAGEPLPGGLVAVHAPGPDEASYVFHRPLGLGALFAGDLVVHEEHGVELLPAKYVADPVRLRASARRVAVLRFALLCFDHGAPLIAGPQQAILAALEAAEAASA